MTENSCSPLGDTLREKFFKKIQDDFDAEYKQHTSDLSSAVEKGYTYTVRAQITCRKMLNRLLNDKLYIYHGASPTLPITKKITVISIFDEIPSDASYEGFEWTSVTKENLPN